MAHGSLLVIPSIISFSRVFLAMAFIAVKTPEVRALLVIVSAFTDFLDGWVARTAKLETRVGALIDPITDRLFMLIAVTVLLSDGLMTITQCVLLLARDLATSVGYVVARIVTWLRPVAFKARFPGKVVTVLQFAAVIVALLRPEWLWPIVAVTGVMAAFAIWDYTLALWRARVIA